MKAENRDLKTHLKNLIDINSNEDKSENKIVG